MTSSTAIRTTERFARMLEVLADAYDIETGVFAFTQWHAAYVAGEQDHMTYPEGTKVRSASYAAYADTVFEEEWDLLVNDARAGEFEAVIWSRGALFATREPGDNDLIREDAKRVNDDAEHEA